MWLVVFLPVYIVVLLQCEVHAYRMTECQLISELRKHSFPEEKLRDWVCLVKNESNRKTDLVSKVNRDGSRDYGLFQINDRYWCSNSTTAGKDCNVTCADLITDDITKAAACAHKVYRRHKFRAWYGWRKHCQGTLPALPAC